MDDELYSDENNIVYRCGPETCDQCDKYGFYNSVFIGYCETCAKLLSYSRGNGMLDVGVENNYKNLNNNENSSIWNTYLKNTSLFEIGDRNLYKYNFIDENLYYYSNDDDSTNYEDEEIIDYFIDSSINENSSEDADDEEDESDEEYESDEEDEDPKSFVSIDTVYKYICEMTSNIIKA
jgi:hypothetical protein